MLKDGEGKRQRDFNVGFILLVHLNNNRHQKHAAKTPDAQRMMIIVIVLQLPHRSTSSRPWTAFLDIIDENFHVKVFCVFPDQP